MTAWAKALTYSYFGAGAAGWVYVGLVAGGFPAVACFICGALSAASPWIIEVTG